MGFRFQARRADMFVGFYAKAEIQPLRGGMILCPLFRILENVALVK
jgi:hypothetical protein